MDINIEEDFKVDEQTALFEVNRLGHLLSRYATLSADARAVAAREKFNYDEVSAQEALRIRSESVKITEVAIKEKLILSPLVKEAKEKLVKAEREQDLLEGLWRAIQKKSDIIVAILYYKRSEMKAY